MNTPPRRVLYLDHTSVLAGGEIALLNLVRALDPNRYVPIVGLLSDGPFAAELKTAGVETHILPSSRALLEARKDSLGGASLLRGGAATAAIGSIFRLKRLIRATRADLVHTNSLKANLLGGIAARLARRPVVWHLRDRISEDYLSPTAARLVRVFSHYLPHHIVANSNATLATLTTDPALGSVIYSGLDLSEYLAIAPRERAGPPRVGIIGRLAEWKGQHVFLQAAAEIKNRIPGVTFQIIGSPLFGETDYESRLHQLADSLGIAPITEFTGFRRDIPALLAQLDLLVHASITGEPFGQVVVQAMAAAKPVVATNGGGIPEVVADGQTGLLVPMNDPHAMTDAVCRILGDTALSEAMGQKARQRARDLFTIQRTAAQTMDLYDRLLAGN
ncbi:MAG: glycosyltransferase family 4 protein [Tepidisphaeraceae bacterium]|jgi:glycosyltransferase involved in cell wall biosynthesis